MIRRKSTLKLTALILVSFFLITGSAQALPRIECKQACCREKRTRLNAGQFHPAPCLQDGRPSVRVPSCGLMNGANTLQDTLPENHTCRDALPACCNAENVGRQIEGITSTPSARTDRTSDGGLSPIPSPFQASGRYRRALHTLLFLLVSAAPPPLYIHFSALLI